MILKKMLTLGVAEYLCSYNDLEIGTYFNSGIYGDVYFRKK